MKKISSYHVLWAIYIALLAVLLPHTAWLFMQFEAGGGMGVAAAWGGAFAFEAAIAVLTHRLSKRIEQTPKRLHGWLRWWWQYGNVYAVGLSAAVVVSALANLAHAVEFGGVLEIFADWGIPAKVYQLAFGGVLPMVSLVFAKVLSREVEEDEAPNEEVERANREVKEVRRELREAHQRLEESERLRREGEQQLEGVLRLAKGLFADEKRVRVLTAREAWPELPQSVIAAVAGASTSYVSEVLHDESRV